jgi:succinate-semialdehyde dehydrogenase/glutarate-semialdehyde dehydrogenase
MLITASGVLALINYISLLSYGFEHIGVSMYHSQLFIDGCWTSSSSERHLDVINPANGEVEGSVAHANKDDMDRALAAAERGFEIWRKTSVFERSKIIRAAATLVRSRAHSIAPLIVAQAGKPLAEAKAELASAADVLDWFSEEARRTYGRVITPRFANVTQSVVKEPVGPVVGFTPWNFPVAQIVRKVGPALAAGCSIIIKGPEEAPAAPVEFFKCLHDAGVPAGVIGLLFGTPAEISSYLIPHPTIRKISFTGSVQVGKHLAAMAGAHMKRATMELGGHAPVIITAGVNLQQAADVLLPTKFRHAGQACVAPTRFLIERSIYREFIDLFKAKCESLVIGNGTDEKTTLGPVNSARRVEALEAYVGDALEKGATLECGGSRIGDKGYFFAPTILSDMTTDMRIMNEEPFGPIALMMAFDNVDDAISEANRLPFGLAAYAWTSNLSIANKISRGVESGMISMNHFGLAIPETPYGGIKDSGIGSEGGMEAIEAYLNTKFVTQMDPA